MAASSPPSRRTRSNKAPKMDLNLVPGVTSRKHLVVDDSSDHEMASPAKKKRKVVPGSSFKKPIVVDDLSEREVASPAKKKRTASKKSSEEEKRLRVFRKKAPLSYLDRLERATSQRMFVIDRNRSGSDDIPQEIFDLAGSTGNVYQVNIGLVPSCTCPDYKKGNQCKHIVYILYKVLKAPSPLQYQLAFLSSELREIYSGAPPPLPSQLSASKDPNSLKQPNNRKEISGDCPICFSEFEPESDEIVWCKAACGNNIHRTCFEQWAKSQKSQQQVRCVFCRTEWQGDEDSVRRIKKTGKVNTEGYVNVGRQLGLSGVRDYSTYHPFWVRSQGLNRRENDYRYDDDDCSESDYRDDERYDGY